MTQAMQKFRRKDDHNVIVEAVQWVPGMAEHPNLTPIKGTDHAAAGFNGDSAMMFPGDWAYVLFGRLYRRHNEEFFGEWEPVPAEPAKPDMTLAFESVEEAENLKRLLHIATGAIDHFRDVLATNDDTADLALFAARLKVRIDGMVGVNYDD